MHEPVVLVGKVFETWGRRQQPTGQLPFTSSLQTEPGIGGSGEEESEGDKQTKREHALVDIVEPCECAERECSNRRVSPLCAKEGR